MTLNCNNLYKEICTAAKYFVEKQGNKFVLDSEIENLYKLISLYFSKNEDFENYFLEANKGKIKYNLQKGLLICGAPGRSKSLVFEKVLSHLFQQNPELRFNKTTSEKIVSQYKLTQESAIDNYIIKKVDGIKHTNLYIDDIGTENAKINIFGTVINPVLHFLNWRYRVFTDFNKKTFATTNLNLNDIGTMYDERLKSRFFEMFNIIIVKGNDLRINLI